MNRLVLPPAHSAIAALPKRLVQIVHLGIAFACFLGTHAAAQQIVVAKLVGGIEHPAEFTRATSIRELKDERVLVADASERRLMLLDWRSRSAEQISRTGEGPGEYKSVTMLWPLRADSTLLLDSESGRWLLLEGTRFVDALMPSRDLHLPSGSLAGVAGDGRVLQTRPFGYRFSLGHGPLLTPAAAESVLVVRVSRADAHTDTIARLRGPFLGMRQAVKGGRSYIYDNPLAVGDQALLFSDGWIAIAQAWPYRVDWVSPSGRRINGAALPYQAVPLDRRQKQAAIDRKWPDNPGFTIDEMPPWPKSLPPFRREALLAAPDGELVIHRMEDVAIDASVYDVVDRRGRLSRRIVLESNEQLVGFGPRWAYIVATDVDDIQHIRRYAWK